MLTAGDYLDELRTRLFNPAISDGELLTYIETAFRDVSTGQYSPQDFRAQVIDSASHYLLVDGKFPEVQSISGGGVSTNFAANDPERYLKKMAGRRQAAWL